MPVSTVLSFWDGIRTYTADQSQKLASHKHPATPKYIAKTTCNRESNGGSNRPSTRDPYDVLCVAQLLSNLLQDTGGKK